ETIAKARDYGGPLDSHLRGREGDSRISASVGAGGPAQAAVARALCRIPRGTTARARRRRQCNIGPFPSQLSSWGSERRRARLRASTDEKEKRHARAGRPSPRER